MAQTTIKVNDHGPYQISGSFEIIDEEGNAFHTTGEVSLCRCGYSDEKPFCDGSHDRIQFFSDPRAKSKRLIEV